MHFLKKSSNFSLFLRIYSLRQYQNLLKMEFLEIMNNGFIELLNAQTDAGNASLTERPELCFRDLPWSAFESNLLYRLSRESSC